MSIVKMLKDKEVEFVRFHDMQLWYKTECGFEFPVPVEDIGNATFMAKDKAVLFMRYVRKYKLMLDKAKAA